jgi:hypothetical protein
MLDRPQVAALDQLGDPELFLGAVSELIAVVQQRSAGVILAAREAARADDSVATITEEIDRRRYDIADWIATGTHRRSRHPTAHYHITTAWLLIDPAIYQQLVSRSGHTAYTTWLRRALRAQLLSRDNRHATT